MVWDLATQKRLNEDACEPRQLHPVDRLDGDNPDGNPGPIALLDEAVRHIEEAKNAIVNEGVDAFNNHESQYGCDLHRVVEKLFDIMDEIDTAKRNRNAGKHR